MKLLHHPHIVGVIEVFETDDFIWIVMEHASCGELFDYIVKNGMVKEPEARHFFRQILSAIEYCHMVTMSFLEKTNDSNYVSRIQSFIVT